MEQVKEKLFLEYIDFLYSSDSTNYMSVGRRIASVRMFLESDYAPNRKGYKAFCLAHSVDIANREFIKEAICDFLAWRGIGYKSLKKKAKGEQMTLEKIDVICDKNKHLLNSFANYLAFETDLSASTRSSYVTGVKLFYQYATEFNVEMCRAFLATMEKKGAAPATINNRINALVRFGDYIKKPVALKTVKIPKTLHTDNVPSMNDYNRLLDYLRGKDMGYYFDIKILATTGARVSEFLQMTWEDVLSGEVTLKGKGSKYRHFFFSKEVVDEARQYVKEHGLTGVVAKNRFGSPLSSRGMAQLMKDWGERLGIDKTKMHPHAFRHFFAKMYLKKNKDVVQLAELLGHSSIDITKIYLQKTHAEQKRDFAKNVTW